MSTNLETAVECYLRARRLSDGTRDSYFTTLKKWTAWGGGVPIEDLRRHDIRDFLDWVYKRAVEKEGMNPGRTANKAREEPPVRAAAEMQICKRGRSEAPLVASVLEFGMSAR